jgi:hypothetical protein
MLLQGQVPPQGILLSDGLPAQGQWGIVSREGLLRGSHFDDVFSIPSKVLEGGSGPVRARLCVLDSFLIPGPSPTTRFLFSSKDRLASVYLSTCSFLQWDF